MFLSTDTTCFITRNKCTNISWPHKTFFFTFLMRFGTFNVLMSSPCGRLLPRRANVLEREDFHALDETFRLKRWNDWSLHVTVCRAKVSSDRTLQSNCGHRRRRLSTRKCPRLLWKRKLSAHSVVLDFRRRVALLNRVHRQSGLARTDVRCFVFSVRFAKIKEKKE